MRLRVVIRGAVQGVGFRPFVHRLASELGLAGWVNNSPGGVVVEVDGVSDRLSRFLVRLQTDRPPRSSLFSVEPVWLETAGFRGFEIRESESVGEKRAVILPDIATCPDCLAEILDPSNRRHRYPFTNCTQCGPRFSIIESVPYDRRHTSMKGFPMCETCRAEYEDPRDRRFHAQPNACPVCGPQLAGWDSRGRTVATADAALRHAAELIGTGHIVAVKGLGGFHLMCLASNDTAVRTLRERKRREEKPFAVMFPGLEALRAECTVSRAEERLLTSPESPIVLLRRRRDVGDGRSEMGDGRSEMGDRRWELGDGRWEIGDGGSGIGDRKLRIAGLVAPGNPYLGALLPYTPLHHLLLREVGAALVATSGNLSDEPICTDEHEALGRLAGVADHFLVHDRPIVRHVDDSIVRMAAGRELVLRRARGYAPLPVQVPLHAAAGAATECEDNRGRAREVLGLGAHLKNAVALAVGSQVWISQHIGDLDTKAAFDAFQQVTTDLQHLWAAPASGVVADRHPDYLSTRFAADCGLPVTHVQHHVAHVLSCMAENELEVPVLGVAWDGTGLGIDNTIWGGEFLRVTRGRDGLDWERVAHLRPFRLPGGEQAVKEPRRSAAGLLQELPEGSLPNRAQVETRLAFRDAELNGIRQMLKRNVNAPWTTSVGRLFDAIAALAGLRSVARHEGQAAILLEFAADRFETEESYALPIRPGRRPGTRGPSGAPASEQGAGPVQLDWEPMVLGILSDLQAGDPAGLIAARFHNALVGGIVAVAESVGVEPVVLTGGCFQNLRLLEGAIRRLRAKGFRPVWHQRVPPNDGGIALGQVAAVRWKVNPVPSEPFPDCGRD